MVPPQPRIRCTSSVDALFATRLHVNVIIEEEKTDTISGHSMAYPPRFSRCGSILLRVRITEHKNSQAFYTAWDLLLGCCIV